MSFYLKGMDVLDDGDLLDYLCIIKALIINADKRKNDSKLNGESKYRMKHL